MILVTLETKSKTDEINSLILDTFGEKKLYWVGGFGSQYPNKFTYKWIATGIEFSYTLWDANEPNFAGSNQYCINIGWGGSKMLWSDYMCHDKNGFICEENPLKLALNNQSVLNENLKEQLQIVKEDLKKEIEEKNSLKDQFLKEISQMTEEFQKLLKIHQKQQECLNITY